MVNRERDDNIYYARLAEQGERYEDMIKHMKEVAKVRIKPETYASLANFTSYLLGKSVESTSEFEIANPCILPFCRWDN